MVFMPVSVCSRVHGFAGVLVLLALVSGCPKKDRAGDDDAGPGGSDTVDAASGGSAGDAAVDSGAAAADAAAPRDASIVEDAAAAVDAGAAQDASIVEDAAAADSGPRDPDNPVHDGGPSGDAAPTDPTDDSGQPIHARWFVNSVTGDDTNDGQSEATAFATLTRLVASPIVSGDVIYLARGSLWREELRVLPQGVVVTAYGNGPRPIIDGSDVAENASFKKTDGFTNVYEIAWTHDFAGDGGKSAHRLWEDGVRLRRAQDLAACDATPGSFYAGNPTSGGPDTIYVHPSDSSVVPSGSHVYELTRRRWALQLYHYQNHASVYSVHTRRNAYADGSLVVDGLISDCLAEDGRVHSVFIRGTCEDTTAWKIEPPTVFGGATMFISFEDRNDVPRVTYRRCKAVADGEAIGSAGGRNLGATVGFYGHTSQGRKFGTAVYEECEASGVALAFGFLDVVDALYYKCTASVGGIIAGGTPDRTLAVLGGTFRTAQDGATLVKFNQDYGVPKKIVVRGVRLIQENGHNTPLWINRANGYTEVTRSTFVLLGSAILWMEKGSFVIKNNIFYADNLITRVYSTDVSYMSDENLHFNINSEFKDTIFQFDLGAFTFGLPAWRTATGQDTNSLLANPLFVGAPEVGELGLAANSPARPLAAGADYEGEENDAVLQSYRASMLSGAGL